MCTAISVMSGRFYFGRNMDYDRSFGEQVVIAPRGFPFFFCCEEACSQHYAMIGMASVMDGYPLYADAVNEKGLCMAGLQFTENACYYEEREEGFYHVSAYELIPWVLSRCATAEEARALLLRTRVTSIPFRADIPVASLHWMIADACGAMVLEVTEEGTAVLEDPVGVLTNTPPFLHHLMHLRQYAGLGNEAGHATLAEAYSLEPFSLGTGALGLPGDYSSPSRFIKAAFLRAHLFGHEDAAENIADMFHLLAAVAPIGRSVLTKEGRAHMTTYSACLDATRGIYYYNTCYNCQLTAVDLHAVNLDDRRLAIFPLKKKQQVLWE
ncbi:MAG: choloylglycine hydrolase [Clostridia bacterium]|nr:choloylglycine hydrolase [Clostridia bacterium]